MTDGHRETEEGRLVAAMAAGDEGALGRAYDAHGRLVYSLARRLLGRPADAEEITQDVFLQLWKRAGSFDPARSPLAAYLLMLTRSRAIDRLRARRARPADGAGEGGLEQVVCQGAAPFDAATLGEARGRVLSVLETLPVEERRVIELAYFEGLSQTEIAERTGTHLGTVKTRARNGLRRLREGATLVKGATS